METTEILAFLKARMETARNVVPNLVVRQNYQPQASGQATDPALYVYHIGDKRRGSPMRTTRVLPDFSTVVTERQTYESTFQITAAADVASGSSTPSDLANLASAIMAGGDTLALLQTYKAGVLLISDVRNPFNVDDRDEYEATPNFDVVITHARVRTVITPVVARVESGIYRV